MIFTMKKVKLVITTLLVFGVITTTGIVSAAGSNVIQQIGGQLLNNITPKNAKAAANDWYNKGVDYQDKNDLDNAIHAYTKAIELDPKLEEAYNNRGNAYADKKQFDLAISDYTKAIEINPNDSDYYYNRGNSYCDIKDFDTAIIDYDKAIELSPKKSSSYLNKALACEDAGRTEEAIAAYRLFLRYAPSQSPDVKHVRERLSELT